MHKFMALKRLTAPLVAIALYPALLALSCAPASKTLELKDAAKTKNMAISAKGTEEFNTVHLQIRNDTGADRNIHIPIGTVLSVSQGNFQPMVIAGDVEILAPAGQTVEMNLPSYSLSFHKDLPGEDELFELKKYKANKDSDIGKILSYLMSDEGLASYPSDDPNNVTIAQQAIWLVTDGIDYGSNIGYVVDSMMFTTILQANPMIVSLFIEDVASISSEEAAQEAIFDLVRNKEALRSKLQMVFADRYQEAADQVRANLEEQVGPAFKTSISDFLAKAGVARVY